MLVVMRLASLFLLVATFLLSGCLRSQQSFEPLPVSQPLAIASEEQTEKVLLAPMRAALLISVRGKVLSLSTPELQFRSERAFLMPEYPNSILFFDTDATWGDFFADHGISLIENCLTFQEETYCAQEGEKIWVSRNGEQETFSSDWPFQAGDRLYIGLQEAEVSREQRALLPDPWLNAD